MNVSVLTDKVCKLWWQILFFFLRKHSKLHLRPLICFFTCHLIKAKARRLLLPDFCPVPWVELLQICTCAASPLRPRVAAGGGAGMRRCRHTQPEEGGEAGPGRAAHRGAGRCGLGRITVASWPDRGWKLLVSSAACSCLNPFGLNQSCDTRVISDSGASEISYFSPEVSFLRVSSALDNFLWSCGLWASKTSKADWIRAILVLHFLYKPPQCL